MKKTILLLLILFISKAVFSQNGLCFMPAPYSPVTVSGLITTMDKADFNNDGQLDFICDIYSGAGFNVILSNGPGAYLPSNYLAVPGKIQFLKVDDFNQDGKSDIVATVYDSSIVYLLLGTGAGTFSLVSRYNVGMGPKSLCISDFNNDSKKDLAIVNSLSNNISILLGNGLGTFLAAVNYSTGANSHTIKSEDFNNDGKIDLITTNGTNSTILKGNGNGTFTFVNTINFAFYAFIPESYTFEALDLTNDNKIDLAGINQSQNSISVIKGNGNFTFQAAINYSVGTTPSSLFFGDFNSDGKPDLVSSNMYSHDISILINNGLGVFGSAVNYTVSPPSSFEHPWLVMVDDMNNDNKPDIIVAKDNSTQITVLLNCNMVDVGIADNNILEETFNLYPNPAIDHINLKFSEGLETNNKIEIINSVGQLIKEEEIILIDKLATISLNDLPNGVYLFNLKSDNLTTVTKRFVISR